MPESRQPLRGGLQRRLIATEQHDPLKPVALRQPGQNRVSDLGGAAHQQDALYVAQ